MTPEELKKLEEEHKKEMEAIQASPNPPQDTLNSGKNMMGL